MGETSIFPEKSSSALLVQEKILRNKVEDELVDEDGNSIEKPYKDGELWIKGDDFFKGYLKHPEETQKLLTADGWLKTGDMFQRDVEGYYYFVERKRLLIRYLGVFVSPLLLEEVIKRHPLVSEACVVGIPEPTCMELAVAAIQRNNEASVNPEDIFTLVRNSLPIKKHLHGGLFFVDSFPTTPSGKLNRAKVRELALTIPRIQPK